MKGTSVHMYIIQNCNGEGRTAINKITHLMYYSHCSSLKYIPLMLSYAKTGHTFKANLSGLTIQSLV
jgi:hypothetical protein